ncbi:MAG: hypothetical protein AAFP70_08740, partial [Calditrichota bacterium]
MFQIVIQSPDEQLRQLIDQQLTLENVEIFTVDSVFEVEQFFTRVKADLFVLTVDREINRMRSTIHTVNTITESDNASVILLLNEHVDVNELRLSIKSSRVTYQDARADIDLLAANIASAVFLERRLKDSGRQERLEDFFQTLARSIRSEQQTEKVLSNFINTLPKLLSVTYCATGVLTEQLNSLHYYTSFQPPLQPYPEDIKNTIASMVESLIVKGETQYFSNVNLPELFTRIRENGQKVDRMFFVPM